MTKQELMETYTAERLAEMVKKLDNENTDLKEKLLKKTGLCGEAKVSFGLHGIECCCGGYDIAVKKNKELQSEINKCCKALENTKKERDCQVAEYHKKIDELKQKLERQETATKYAEEYVNSLKCSVDRKQDAINQIDSIICELFGIAHSGDIYSDDFKELLKEKSAVGKTVTDFLPTEPIAVAEMLINAEGEYKHNPLTKKICGNDKGAYRIFDVSELRQIAEYLLVYCNHHKETENDKI